MANSSTSRGVRWPPCVEVLDDAMVRVLRGMSGAERLRIANGMFRSVSKLLNGAVREQHPDWGEQQIAREVARRISLGS